MYDGVVKSPSTSQEQVNSKLGVMVELLEFVSNSDD
jgi:hypothetical protein